MANANLERLRTLTNQLVIDETEKESVLESLVASHRRLTVMNQLVHVFIKFLTLPNGGMYAEVLSVVLEALKSPYGVFGFLRKDGAFVCPSMTRDVWEKCQVPDKSIEFPAESWADSNAGWARCLREKKSNYSNEPGSTPPGHIAITRFMNAPVLFNEDVIGIFEIANKSDDYTDTELQLLESIATYVAPVLYAKLVKDGEL